MVRIVIKRDNKKEKFNPAKIYNAIFKASRELYLDKEADNIAKVVSNKVLEELSKYKKEIHIENIQDIIEKVLMQEGFQDVAKVYILYRRYRQEIRDYKERIGIKDELKLSINAITILKERYLLRDKNRNVIETPVEMFRRVADYIAKIEKDFSKEENFYREEFFKQLISLKFLPNSPTLMNAGTPLGQLSACFVLPIYDSIASIFDSLKAMALIHKSGGGTGFSFSNLRPKGDIVFSTKGIASGPLSFAKIFDSATGVILQGGKRRGANMAVLKVDHPDIVEFVESKLKENVLENFNISVGITDEFMHAFRKNLDFELINPRTKKVVKKIKAKSLFSIISFCAYKCAEPGLLFLGHINKANPLKSLGVIEATNPCGEVPLFNYESCNLGSINLAKFVSNKKVNWQDLEKTIKMGIRFLDNVIELNNYPLKEIELISKKNRKIGLGVMGFSDMLIKLRLPYNSKEAIRFAEKLMRFIREVSLKASCKLAYERGVFENYKYSVYKKKGIKLRNATLNSIAPTGSISIIAGCSSGIEPLFALSFTRNVFGKTRLFEINPLVEEVIREEGFYSKRLINEVLKRNSIRDTKGIPKLLKNIFVTTFDILPIDHLKMQAAFQKFTDNAVSKTINLPPEANIEDVKDIYIKAYDLKLKGITVYRYGSREEQVLYKYFDESEKIEVSGDFSGGCFREVCGI